FNAFMKQPHFQYYAGEIEGACRDDKNARKRWTRVAVANEMITSPEFVFPILAAWKLDPEKVKPKIAAALELVRKDSSGDPKSKARILWLESALLAISGNRERARAGFEQLLRTSDDVWLKYFATVEMRRHE